MGFGKVSSSAKVVALRSHEEPFGEKEEESLGRGEMCGGEELHRWQWEETWEHVAVCYNMKNVFRVCLL